ncbi:hypothetical protein ACR2R6_01595 [Methylocaldum gracile subsp. desertum]|uniref:hypothetical protein n=1 Tax=Methylocaldum sp. GT1BW TaxID=3438964 RepID=UPI003DA1387D
MGVNLFVEGNPTPVVITIRLARPVESFKELDDVVKALNTVDSVFSKEWPKMWPDFYPRQRREVHLLSFRVASPPEFKILADPAWLAVFIAVIAGYKNIKENIREIGIDTKDIFRAIKGLTDRELELLHIAVRLSLGRAAELGEQQAIQIANKLKKARMALLGESEQPPDVKVINVDKDQWW